MRFGKLHAETQRILAEICDLELRFRAATGGRAAIWEIASLKRCDFGCDAPPPLAREVEVRYHPCEYYLSGTCAIPHEGKETLMRCPFCDTSLRGIARTCWGISNWVAMSRAAKTKCTTYKDRQVCV